MVSIGLVSYSAYLFHQPIISFLKIYSINLPSTYDYIFAIVLTFCLAWFSYRFIESPFRNKERVSMKSIFLFSFKIFLFFISGSLINATGGIPDRLNENLSPLEKSKVLSQRAWAYKNDSFKKVDKLNILVVGNSYGRDVVNMLIETFEKDDYEIIYRDDMNSCSYREKTDLNLFSRSEVIIFASNYLDQTCNIELINNPSFAKKYFLWDIRILATT